MHAVVMPPPSESRPLLSAVVADFSLLPNQTLTANPGVSVRVTGPLLILVVKNPGACSGVLYCSSFILSVRRVVAGERELRGQELVGTRSTASHSFRKCLGRCGTRPYLSGIRAGSVGEVERAGDEGAEV